MCVCVCVCVCVCSVNHSQLKFLTFKFIKQFTRTYDEMSFLQTFYLVNSNPSDHVPMINKTENY